MQAQSASQQTRSPLTPMPTMQHPIASANSAATSSTRIPVPKRLVHGQPVSSLSQHRTPSVNGGQHATPLADATPAHVRLAIKHQDMASAAPAVRMAGRYNLDAAPVTSRRRNDENVMAQSRAAPRQANTDIPKASKSSRRKSGGMIPSSRRSLGLAGPSRGSSRSGGSSSSSANQSLRRTVTELTRALGQNRADWQGQKDTLATLQDLFDKSTDDALASLEPVLSGLVDMLASLVTEARAQVVPDVCAVLCRIATKLTTTDCLGGAALGPAVSSLARVSIKRGSSTSVSNVALDCLGTIFNSSDSVPLAELLCGYDSWCLSGESANVVVTLALRSWDQSQRIAHVTDLLKLVKERSNDLYANSSEHKQSRFGAYAVWKLDFTMSCVAVAALCDSDRATIGMEYPDLMNEIKRVAPTEDDTHWYEVDRVLLLKGKQRENLLLRQHQVHKQAAEQSEQSEQSQAVSGEDDVADETAMGGTPTVGATTPVPTPTPDVSHHGMTASLVAAAAAQARDSRMGGGSASAEVPSREQATAPGSKSKHNRMEMLGQWKLHQLGLDQPLASASTASSSTPSHGNYEAAASRNGSASVGTPQGVDGAVQAVGTPTSSQVGTPTAGTPGYVPKAPASANQCPRSDAVKAVLKDKTRRFGSTMRKALLSAAQAVQDESQHTGQVHPSRSAPLPDNSRASSSNSVAFGTPQPSGPSGRTLARRPIDESAADANAGEEPSSVDAQCVPEEECADGDESTDTVGPIPLPSTPIAAAVADPNNPAKVFLPGRTLARTPIAAPVVRGTGRIPSPFKATPSKLGGTATSNGNGREMTPMKAQIQALAAAIEQDEGFHSARSKASTAAAAGGGVDTPFHRTAAGNGTGLSRTGMADLQKRIDAMTKRLQDSKNVNRNMAAVFDSARASVGISPEKASPVVVVDNKSSQVSSSKSDTEEAKSVIDKFPTDAKVAEVAQPAVVVAKDNAILHSKSPIVVHPKQKRGERSMLFATFVRMALVYVMVVAVLSASHHSATPRFASVRVSPASDVNDQAVASVVIDAEPIDNGIVTEVATGIDVGRESDAQQKLAVDNEAKLSMEMETLTARVAKLVREEAGLAAVAAGEAIRQIAAEEARAAMAEVEAEAKEAEASRQLEEEVMAMRKLQEAQELQEQEAVAVAARAAEEEERAEIEAAEVLAREREQQQRLVEEAQAQAEVEAEARRIEVLAKEAEEQARLEEQARMEAEVARQEEAETRARVEAEANAEAEAEAESARAREAAERQAAADEAHALAETEAKRVQEEHDAAATAAVAAGAHPLIKLLSPWAARVREILQARAPLLVHNVEQALSADTLDPLAKHAARVFQQMSCAAAVAATLGVLTSGFVSVIHTVLLAVFG